MTNQIVEQIKLANAPENVSFLDFGIKADYDDQYKLTGHLSDGTAFKIRRRGPIYMKIFDIKSEFSLTYEDGADVKFRPYIFG